MKIQPIHEKLWGALNIATNEISMALAITRSRDTRLAQANELLKEYASCFGADGRVSQRGEIPQCWNPETIFTPHREFGEEEVCYNQLLLPFEVE
jgi:hypothetical protein